MEKKLLFGEKEVKFSSCLAWTLIYKSQFGRDAAKILIPGVKVATGESEGKDMTFSLYEELGFSGIVEIAWSMAKLADKSIPPLEDWIISFGDDFDPSLLVEEIIPEAILSCFSSKNSSAPIRQEMEKALTEQQQKEKQTQTRLSLVE